MTHCASPWKNSWAAGISGVASVRSKTSRSPSGSTTCQARHLGSAATTPELNRTNKPNQTIAASCARSATQLHRRPNMQRRVLKIADLATRPGRPGMLPLSESTIRRLVIAGQFPKPYKLGAATVWNMADVEAIITRQAANVVG
ncbi:MAG: AlpA family phage regulatory protein [Betaproteobacteria bacterium]|nr:AlpA family phage regulatory protein [Betaproteobacteria bacterium]